MEITDSWTAYKSCTSPICAPGKIPEESVGLWDSDCFTEMELKPKQAALTAKEECGI